MTIDQIRAEDAPALALLAAEFGQNTFMWSPGSVGIVARDEAGIHGFALLCERPYGQVIDELWCAKNRRGLLATSAIIEWLESHVTGHVGGIVRQGSPLYDVLSKRGYAVTAHVLTKAVA